MSGAAPALTAARERAIGTWSRALGGLNVAYLIATGVQCTMLLMINPVSVTPPTPVLTIDMWAFWRFFLTAFNLVPAAVFGYVAATACGCRSRPNVGAVVIGIMHVLWCLIVLAFAIMDLVRCPTTPWCSVPLGGPRSIWFLIWFIAQVVCIVMEFMLTVFAGMLYGATRGACARRCIARAGFGGAGVTPGGFGTGVGAGAGPGFGTGAGAGLGFGAGAGAGLGTGTGAALEEGQEDLGADASEQRQDGGSAGAAQLVLVGMPMAPGARAEEARARAAKAAKAAFEASDPLTLGADVIGEIARLQRAPQSIGGRGGARKNV